MKLIEEEKKSHYIIVEKRKMPKKTSKKEENKFRKKIKMNKNIEEERNTRLFQKKSKKM